MQSRKGLALDLNPLAGSRRSQLIASAMQCTLATGVTRSIADYFEEPVRTKLTISSTVTTADHTTSGASGSKKLLDFPEGVIVILGAYANLAISESGGIGATATVNCALGSAAAGADATLTSTEADIVPSTAVVLTASAGTFAAAGTTPKALDGHATPAAVYLNMSVSDADNTDAQADTVTVTGTVEILWARVGDF